MPTTARGRAARSRTTLVIVIALALAAGACTSADEPGPPGPGGPGGATGVLAMAAPGEPLTVKLSAGSPASGAEPEPIPVVAGQPLDETAVAAILERLPEWIVPDDDRTDFNRPPESLRPPRVGETIDVPFPAGGEDQPPDVPAGPLEVLRFQPEGPVDVAPFISITFNQPMVPLATVDQLGATTVPVTITPDIPGSWQWIGTRTLRFEHRSDLIDRLPMATEYTVEIPAGTTSETGGRLARTVSWEFSTPPPRVQSFEPEGQALPLEPVFLAEFDQRVDPAAVLRKITLTAGGSAQELRLATAAEIADDEAIGSRVDTLLDGRWVAFRATRAFTPDTPLQIDIGPGTPSAEGPRTTPTAATYSARTYAPLQIDDWSCKGPDRCEPGGGLWIRFNNPLDLDEFDPALVALEPAIPGMSIHASFDSISIDGATVGGTTYTATVDPEIRDVFGQELGDDGRVEFVIDDARPQLVQFRRRLITLDPLAPEPSLAVTTVNHDELRVRLFRVDPDDWKSFVVHWERQWDDRPQEPPSSWREVFDEVIDTDARANEFTETTIELDDALDGGPGHVVVLVEPAGRLADLSRDDNDYWNNRPTLAWAQATSIGADAFDDDAELLVWATDLATGAPLDGVDIGFAVGGATAKTNSDGLARLPKPATESQSTEHLIVRRGDDSALVDADWQRRLRHDQAVWYVFDDRQMYRPGETAHFKGWVRRLTLSDDAQLAQAGDATASYRVNDWFGNEIAQGSVELNALGGFDFTVDIPEGANLGQAWINFNLEGAAALNGDYFHTFQIQEFRRPEFEVTARTETEGPYISGKPATVSVGANYFAGGPLPNAEVEWTVTTRRATYSPPNWDDFTFGIWIPWWFDDFYAVRDGFAAEADIGFSEFPPQVDPGTVERFFGHTDAAGNHYLRMDFSGNGEGLPTTVTSEAAVFDVNRQAWASGVDLLVHPGELYVGVRSARTFVEQGEPIEIEAIVTDIDGAAIAGRQIEMEAGRLEWRFINGLWDEVPVEIETCRIASAGAPVECSFATTIGGTYRITATVADSAGRTSRTEVTRWVSGGDRRPERNVTQEEVTLIPDAETYAPGDTAEILVQAPFGPAEGLLTLSRNGFVSTERFRIDADGTTLSIPIADDYIPNVHIQVDLVGTATRTADDGTELTGVPDRPAFAAGSLNLPVPPLRRTLEVTTTPADPTTEPGAATSVDVTVRDAAGAAVAGAELAVVVVDEAVLALSNYELPDPLEIFYRPIDSQVSSHYARSAIELANPELLQSGGEAATTTVAEALMARVDDGADFVAGSAAAPAAEEAAGVADYGGGGDGTGAIDVRTNFDALAVFAPEVTTDAAGNARVDVPLPDNLTRYRVMVVAVSGPDRFGSGEANITARLPLMIRPSAPRFLNFGDEFELPVVIQNQTDESLQVDAVIETANLALPAGAGRRVTVPANDRIEVRFPAAAAEVGIARFRVAAVSGSMSDAATVALPVYTPATSEAFATYGVIDDGAIAQTVLAPTGVFPQFGGLEVNTSSTALHALTDAVIYLHDYRYESADALASRILAIAALRDVLAAFDAEGLPPAAELNAQVAEDIAGLLRLQTPQGGFAIWRRTNETVPYHSIQATHALVEAKANGYAVQAGPLEQALWYLANIEDFYPADYSQQLRDSLSAYALYVRNLAGDRDSAKADQLYRRAGDELELDAIARLWPILDDPAADAAIERLLRNRTTETAGAATFSTDYGEDAYVILHSDRRTDGIVLDALISEAPQSDLIPKVVAGLLGNQTRGRWSNVQENAFILLALNKYFDTFEATTPDFVTRIWLGDLYAAEHTFSGRTTDRGQTIVPMAELLDKASGGVGALVVSKDGAGRLYYRLGLRYAPDDLDLEPRDRGFVVQRSYEAIDDPGDVTQAADGTWRIKPGAMVRVRLTMVADSQRTHVALVDPLPAGLEPLNPELAVTGPIPSEEDPGEAVPFGRSTYWWWRWYEHQNLRDDRAEAFASLLPAGTYDFTYVARATTPGTFVVPPTKAEEIYAPETFGRSSSDVVVVAAS